MNKSLPILLSLIVFAIITGCNFINNSFTFKDKTKACVDALIKEDYDGVIKQFDLQSEIGKTIDTVDFRKKLPILRNVIIENFGTNLSYELAESTKRFSTIKDESTPPGTTLAFIRIYNDRDFGMIKAYFDDKSGKLLSFNILLDVKEPIPDKTLFWILGLFLILVPIFNVYVIILIKRSTLKRKWLKYIAVIVLNIPTIIYSSVGGFLLKLGHFQFLGLGFSYLGIMGGVWKVGIPLAGLYWFWRLKIKKDEPEVVSITEAATDDTEKPEDEDLTSTTDSPSTPPTQ